MEKPVCGSSLPVKDHLAAAPRQPSSDPYSAQSPDATTSSSGVEACTASTTLGQVLAQLLSQRHSKITGSQDCCMAIKKQVLLPKLVMVGTLVMSDEAQIAEVEGHNSAG